MVGEVIKVSHREAIELALKFDEVTDTALELETNEQKLRANDYIQDRGLLQRGAVDNLSHVDLLSASATTAQTRRNVATHRAGEFLC
jgi:hypothetical protein